MQTGINGHDMQMNEDAYVFCSAETARNSSDLGSLVGATTEKPQTRYPIGGMEPPKERFAMPVKDIDLGKYKHVIDTYTD